MSTLSPRKVAYYLALALDAGIGGQVGSNKSFEKGTYIIYVLTQNVTSIHLYVQPSPATFYSDRSHTQFCSDVLAVHSSLVEEGFFQHPPFTFVHHLVPYFIKL